MNNILKLFVCVFIAMGANVCRADDEAVVTDTVTEVVDNAVADDSETDAETDVDDADAVDTDVTTPTAPTAQALSVRMDCKTMKAKIDELKAGGASDELSQLQSQYRRDCVVRASGRRSMYRGGMLTVIGASNGAAKANAMASMPSVKAAPQAAANTTATKNTVEISDAQKQMCERLKDEISNKADDVRETLQGTYDEYCSKNVAAPDAVIKTTMIVLGPVETEEEKYARIAANLDAGLCPDGGAPNKFGCCKGEKFKDLGNLVFACCPESGGNCFPPVK